ncbi:hypothetical protein E1295_20145 [Nonomuraea mesophila]|uniref:Uncharacterized protein n=1 Tax=Nonomuraea mesophila TaxID=2530382 RepID=A0A4R5FFR8_9ACTN|nr:hypothetical protein [Nonomuraea mesophila]TDE49729.1 hypothetical protein E1295_20145 [Nonomuraea mesophila]
MLEQPDSVIAGTGAAVFGSQLLGWNRARYATLILPLMYGLPAQQQAAADEWERLAAALERHPDRVDSATRDVEWSAASAELYKDTVLAYSDDAAQKVASPRATADTLRVTANVYDVLGKAVFATGTGIALAGLMHRFAAANPFTRVAAEVAATGFGRRADHQAATIAARARTFAEGGKGVLGKAVQMMAKTRPRTKALLGGGFALMAGWEAQSAVAGRLSDTRLESSPQATTGLPGSTGSAGLTGSGTADQAGPGESA